MSPTTATQIRSVRPRPLRSLVCCLFLAGGCASNTQGEQVRHARMECVDERADSEKKSVEGREDARNDAVENRYDNQEQRVEAADQPGESGSKQLVEISKERAEYQSKAQARVEKFGTRINAADQKLKILGPHAPSGLKSELQTATKQYDQLKEEVSELHSAPSDHWEHATKAVEQDEKNLDTRMSKLEDSIDDQ